MSLQPGTRLGVFEIIEPLGRGGMGEVYRAHDTRLQRDVALKVLPDHHRSDPERLARFTRESLVLAALAHPHIATLFGIEESGAVTALVMELVDGATLGDHIARHGDIPHGRGLSYKETLSIARQIAQALEAAHSRGIMHRDLKPSNIMVGRDGAVKVLDFGLAAIHTPVEHADVSAPTLTLTAGAYAVMGTPAYMSPEQVRGEALDHRTDIWSFGCVLYEMLTGHRAFDGESTVGAIASVLEREPDLTALPPDTPAAIRRLLRRALSKDKQNRLRDVGDARLEIADAIMGIDEGKPAAGPAPVGSRRAYAWLATAAGAVGGSILVWLLAQPAAPTARVSRFAVSVPPDVATLPGFNDITISPDGARLAFASPRGLILRHRERLAMEMLDIGNDAGRNPFFSPDGRWIGYTSRGSIMKVSVTGGSPLAVAAVSSGATGSWGDGIIVFADATGLYRVPEGGGTPEKLSITLGSTEQAAFPDVLPGDEVILFTVLPTRTNTIEPSSQSPQARIDALDLRTGTQTTVVRGGGRPQYARSGHLLYAANQTLYSLAFDAEGLETRGDAVQVVTDVGSATFAVSDGGTLAYYSGQQALERELVWVDRRGQEESLGAPLREYVYPRLSPDETRVAVDVGGPDRDIWIWNIPRRVLERFTLDPAENMAPSWSPDGKHLTFGSSRSGVPNVFWQAADGSGQPERLLESARLQQPITFTPDGRLLVSEAVPGRDRDVFALSLDGSLRMEPILTSEATEAVPHVSPDAEWIAYDSNESGQFEIYVRPYRRSGGGRLRVSTAGGRQPLWSPDGRELFYRDFTGALMVVAVTPNPTFTVGPPTRLIDGATYMGRGSQLGGRMYDISRDGSRFLMIKTKDPDEITPPTIVMVENWFEELNSLVPPR